MSYFSRLTDIVTCNLSHLLRQAEDPRAAITEIIAEMREGLAGAKRSVATARASVTRLQDEINEHQTQVAYWTNKAKQELQAGDEAKARQALLRKREVDDLIAGLVQQHEAAVATREQLLTTHRALEARLAEALRREQNIDAAEPVEEPAPSAVDVETDDRARQIDAELEELKRSLGG